MAGRGTSPPPIRFLSTGSLAVPVLSGPPLSAATFIITIEVAASERALVTGLGAGWY